MPANGHSVQTCRDSLQAPQCSSRDCHWRRGGAFRGMERVGSDAHADDGAEDPEQLLGFAPPIGPRTRPRPARPPLALRQNNSRLSRFHRRRGLGAATGRGYQRRETRRSSAAPQGDDRTAFRGVQFGAGRRPARFRRPARRTKGKAGLTRSRGDPDKYRSSGLSMGEASVLNTQPWTNPR